MISATLGGVPPFPPVASRLMRLMGDDLGAISYAAVADLIRTDAAFSAEVLRLANSSVFGPRYQVRDIPHALAVLGMNRLRAVITTLAMREFVLSGRQHRALGHAWRHSFATALACEQLAGAMWLDSGLAYTAGLLHDVGIIAMVVAKGGAYAELVANAPPHEEDFLARESELLGFDHCEAGQWLLGLWGLPPEFAQATARHHEKPGADAFDLPALTHLGCHTANMAGFSISSPPPPWRPEEIISQLPSKVQGRYRSKIEDLPLSIATRINSFDCEFMA